MSVIQPKNRKPSWIWILAGTIPVIWLAVRVAPAVPGGFMEIVRELSVVFERPFDITLTPDSGKVILVFLIAYFVGVGIYYSTRKNTRRGEEHGSAQWADLSTIGKKYASGDSMESKILTQNVRIDLNQRRHGKNLNVLVIGGSGAGKTRFYAKPNILQCNSSYVILDPKAELIRDTGNLLLAQGYKIRVLDLINPERSHGYNPFVYVENDKDLQRLVTNFFSATTPKGSQTQEPFWDAAAQSLLLALMFYLVHKAPAEEQNFPMVMEMIRAGEVREDDDGYQSPLDELFERLEMDEPNHIAVRYYKDYHCGSAKTLKSIQITLTARLQKFNLSSIEALTIQDELELLSLGTEKTALFALIPDNDTSFNFLVSMLYQQLFEQLYSLADHTPEGRLPIHVHFVMDEFANVSLPVEFEKILSTMRSREISVSIIIQNLAQIKALYEKQWESIVGNCSEILYLGGSEQSSHKFVSEMMGKSTIDTNTYGRTYGSHGNYTTNYQNAGRELMTPDEVRMLDRQQAILLISEERPVIDRKYDLLKHPNIALTADGDGTPYIHNLDTRSVAGIELIGVKKVAEGDRGSEDQTDWPFEIMSEQDLKEYLQKEESD